MDSLALAGERERETECERIRKERGNDKRERERERERERDERRETRDDSARLGRVNTITSESVEVDELGEEKR